ncbi:MAG: hypothetical protein IPN16_16665 [Gemmatimonadetes bacterium]|nr:hypothetical protein [Gemmatimonadota bacterium]
MTPRRIRRMRRGGALRDGRLRPAFRAAVDVLTVLRDEAPTTYHRAAVLLEAAPARVVVGEEVLGVSAGNGIVLLREDAPVARRMEVSLDHLALVRLVDGTTTLEQLLELGLLEVRGHPDALLAFLGAARAVGAAGTRSAALQRIFERFREEVG